MHVEYIAVHMFCDGNEWFVFAPGLNLSWAERNSFIRYYLGE